MIRKISTFLSVLSSRRKRHILVFRRLIVRCLIHRITLLRYIVEHLPGTNLLWGGVIHYQEDEIMNIVCLDHQINLHFMLWPAGLYEMSKTDVCKFENINRRRFCCDRYDWVLNIYPKSS